MVQFQIALPFMVPELTGYGKVPDTAPVHMDFLS